MKYRDFSFSKLAENLAFDDIILETAIYPGADPLLWTWEPPETGVVLGYGKSYAEECHPDRCLADGVPILRRISGGGTVLQAKGMLNFSLFFPADHPDTNSISKTTHHVMTRHRDLINTLLGTQTCSLQGTSDLALLSPTGTLLKCCGNAQKRGRTGTLFHGSFLLKADLGAISRYLTLPKIQPDYRNQRSHADFLINLPLDAATLKVKLTKTWQAHSIFDIAPYLAQTLRLAQDKYGDPSWSQKV
ncbi:MAG: biotin/lipoate A/B protein ligase family protein [Candidatus Margulisiibacteriota bacterium]